MIDPPTNSTTTIKLCCIECGAEFHCDSSRKKCSSCDAKSIAQPRIVQDPLVGQLIGGKYLVGNLIAAGGMGRVYSATHEELNTEVAIKFLPDTEMNVDRLKRFQHEARLASSINHPGVVRILDFGVDSSPYIVMEKVLGESLSDLIEKGNGIEASRAIKICIGIAQAMSEAHNAGLLHRDLKPSNVMIVGSSDTVKIIDFGLAKAFLDDVKLTKTGETIGSPPYMSPEQCRGDVLDVRSDIYSFGCMMYELLTGRPPFRSENMIAAIFSHLEDQAKPLKQIRPDLTFPKGLELVVNNCLNKSPESRYQTMDALKEDLLNVSKGKPIKKLVVRRASQKNQVLWTVARSTAILVLVPVILYLIFVLEPIPPLANNANELAIGDQARTDGLIPITMQERRSLNGLSREQFFQLRRKQADENGKLLLKPYTPFDLAFKNIDFKVPWLSSQGLMFAESDGPAMVQGDSVESDQCMNPLLLIEGRIIDAPNWNREFIGNNTSAIEKFPFRGQVQSLEFNPRKQKSVVRYNITDYVERTLELNDWTDYDLLSSPVPVELANSNAWDFGYNYMFVNAEKDGKVTAVTKEPVRVCQSFHRVSRFHGVECNCAHVPRGAERYFTAATNAQLPFRERVSLWKKEPKSASQRPDFTCIVNFDLDKDAFTNEAYLRGRIATLKKEEGADSKSLLSVYRRLGQTMYTKLEQQPEARRTACGECYGDAIRIAGITKEASEDLRGLILPEFLSTLSGDSTDSKVIDHVAEQFKWTRTTKDLASRAIGTGQGLPLLFWKTLSFELLSKGKNAQALTACKNGVKFFPNDAYLFENLTLAAVRLEEWADAEDAARKVLVLAPEEANTETLLYLCTALRNQRKFQQAIEFATRAIKLKPGDEGAYFELAYNAAQAGQLKQAEGAARTLVQISEDKFKATITLAAILEAQGQADEAMQLFKKAESLAKSPDEKKQVADYLSRFHR